MLRLLVALFTASKTNLINNDSDEAGSVTVVVGIDRCGNIGPQPQLTRVYNCSLVLHNSNLQISKFNLFIELFISCEEN